jgi:hypothetical protein
MMRNPPNGRAIDIGFFSYNSKRFRILVPVTSSMASLKPLIAAKLHQEVMDGNVSTELVGYQDISDLAN